MRKQNKIRDVCEYIQKAKYPVMYFHMGLVEFCYLLSLSNFNEIVARGCCGVRYSSQEVSNSFISTPENSEAVFGFVKICGLMARKSIKIISKYL